MKKRKQILFGILGSILLFSFFGCGTNEGEEFQEIETQMDYQALESEFMESEILESNDMGYNESLITDIYSDVIYDKNFSDELLCYHIPQIHLNKISADELNTKIYNKLYGILEENVYANKNDVNYFPSLSEMVYEWGMKENIASIVVETNHSDFAWTEYYVYNFSIKTGEEITNSELLKKYNLTEADFYKLAEEAMQIYWDSKKDMISVIGEEEYNTLVENTVSQENVKKVIPYINENGELCVVANIYSPFDAESYLHLLNIFSQVEESDLMCKVNHSKEDMHNVTETTESVSEITHSLISKQELLGEWELDSEYTMEYNDMSLRDIYGSSISGTNPLMVFQENGSFSYYIAYDYGNGSYVLEEDGVLINLTELDSGERVRKLLVTEDGKVRIGMEHDFFWTFWIKNQ